MASTARELYADRFPYASRNERKQQLHIDRMEFTVCGKVYDKYGDGWHRELYFTLGRKTHTVTLRQEDETIPFFLTVKEMRRLLNVIVNNYEVFCWGEDYGFSDSADADDLWEDEWDSEIPGAQELPDEPEYEDTSSWEVSVSYLNGEVQEMCGYDNLPNRINELTLELLALFEDEPDTADFESEE